MINDIKNGIVNVIVALKLDRLTRSVYDVEKLMKQHEIDIQNLKEKHKLEMKMKDKEYQHEI